ncbi:MAG: tetratricopeptide repeat protein [Acidobacteria bacterium]|nr:tetratricopeptide repeat protein [Acidobacteriota bacterium]
MTKIYCGWCGSASGAQARFCRSCGGEIAAQSGPLSARYRSGEGPRSATGRLSDSAAQSGDEATGSVTTGPWSSATNGEDSDGMVAQEERAVQALKRLRSSGPLIIEEAMSRSGSLSGLTDQTADWAETVGEEPAGDDGGSVAGGPGSQSSRMDSRADNQSAVTGKDGVGTTGSRDQTTDEEPVRRSDRPPPSLTPGPRAEGGSGSVVPPGQSEASRVLVDASGLQSGLQLSPGVRIGLIVSILLVSSAGYLMFREHLLSTSGMGGDARELHSPKTLSEEAVRMGDQMAASDLTAAAASYARAIQLNPDNKDALFKLARTYQQLGRDEEALTTYTKLLRISPEDLEARLSIARIHQARNDWPAAYREFQRIIALDQNSPQSSQALEEIENYEARRAGEASVTRAARKRSPRLNLPPLPASRVGHNEISLQPPGIPLNIEVRPPAAPAAERPDPEALVASRRELGLRYLNINEYRAAIKEFLIVLRVTPDDKDIYYFLASAYHGLEMYSEAHDYYKRVDSGRYVQVAQSGAKRTERAAADQRRRISR